jgi:predicted ABC-type ATPase
MKPKLLVIAGPNGSGKTSLTSKILKHDWIEGCVYINPDNIARDVFGDWNSPEAVLKAAQYASQKREECLKNRESLLFETVLSAPDKIEFIVKARQEGYFIRLFFVGTDHPAINASRIVHRVLEGGHDVPISKIVSRYTKSIANCSQVSLLVDRLYVYDNSIDDVFPKLLFRASDGKLEKIYANINPWAEEIVYVLRKNSVYKLKNS